MVREVSEVVLKMKPTIDPEFKSFIPPLSQPERDSLRDAIIAAGRALEVARRLRRYFFWDDALR
jgi:hypothetical protein